MGEYTYDKVSKSSLSEITRTIFNKDGAKNNSMHYSYMVELPEVRQIIRENGFSDERSKSLNSRGQLPRALRHLQKVEYSSDDTDDENLDMLDALEAKMDLCIVGQKAVIHEDTSVDLVDLDVDDKIEFFLAGKKDFDVNDKTDRYFLMNTDELSVRQKIAHYN